MKKFFLYSILGIAFLFTPLYTSAQGIPIVPGGGGGDVINTGGTDQPGDQPGDQNSTTFSLTETQLSGMGTALTQGGTGLLHIAIQLMPYAIVMIIIMIVFGIIKNWSKLKDGFFKPKYIKGRFVNKLNINDPFDRSYFDDTVDELIQDMNFADSQSGLNNHQGSYRRRGNKVYFRHGKNSTLDDTLIIDDIYTDEGYGYLEKTHDNSSDYYDWWLKHRKKRK